MQPTLARDPYGVTLVGEALSAEEAAAGRPFIGASGFMLTRIIEWAGLDRDRFDIVNAAWCRPPVPLDGSSFESAAVGHCRTHHWGSLLDRSRVIVPLGNVALQAMLGRKGILGTRGYVYGAGGQHVIPTLHPSFLRRGQSKYVPAVINDLQKAVELAQHGLPCTPVDFVLDPSPMVAYEWAKRAVSRASRIAFDIETPGKGDDEGDVSDDDDPTYTILRLGFADGAGSALSFPFSPEYHAATRVVLESGRDLVGWNLGFDVPRLKAAGFTFRGRLLDGMVAWHVLHSDLPKGLAFVATFCCPWQHEWKSLSHSRPAYYNAVDCDVTWQAMVRIEEELRRTGLWDVYDRDVLRIDPILTYMSSMGMPIDAPTRYDRALRLSTLQDAIKVKLEQVVPRSIRRIAPPMGFVKPPPTITDDLTTITVTVPTRTCDRCGMIGPTKPHFRTIKRPTAAKPQNPCAGAGVVVEDREITRYARIEPLKLSRDILIRYQVSHKRPVPMKWDKKKHERRPSMDGKAIEGLRKKYPDDQLYPLVIEYRAIDKLAGGYIGRIPQR